MARTKNTTAARNAAHTAAHTAPGPAPAPGTGPGPTGPAAAVQAALAANPGGATTAGIAATAGISRTAAGKMLAELETAGTATRTKAGRPGIPDTWRPAQITPAGPPPEDLGAAGSPDTAGAAGNPAAAAPAGKDQAAAGPAAGDREPGPGQRPATGHPASSLPPGGQDDPGGQDITALQPTQDATTGAAAPKDTSGQPAGNHPAGGEGAEAPPDPAVTAEAARHAGRIAFAAQAVTTALNAGDLPAALAGIEDIHDRAGQARRMLKTAGGRKAPAARPGVLRELVAAHLRDHPGVTFTPHQIGKKLGRSSGAVANALDRLVSLGEAQLATDKPRSFRFTGHAAPASQQAGTTSTGDEDAAAGASAQPVARTA